MLAIETVPTAFVVATACVGGAGDNCEGGSVVYSGTSPGFNELLADDPNVPLYRLPDGVEVRIELTAADAGTRIIISGATLDALGETAVVNASPHLHNHPMWLFIAPGGGRPEDRHLSFRLHADGFAASAEIRLTLRAFE